MSNPVVVITGSTRGIGAGLAKSFAEKGCSVVVSGRSQSDAEAGAKQLGANNTGSERFAGIACDVTDRESLQKLWDGAVKKFGRVDHWIMNAGISQSMEAVWDLPPTELDAVVATNLGGSMHGMAVAVDGLRKQSGGGWVWLMEGFGSDGRTTEGLAAYGASKRAVRYLAKAANTDAKDLTGVRIGTISPGIVATDLLMGDLDESTERGAKAAKVYRILADNVETVTPWLADKVLAATKSGTRIAWLTPMKAAGRFISSPFSKRDPLGAAK